MKEPSSTSGRLDARATPLELADNPAAAGRIERWYPKEPGPGDLLGVTPEVFAYPCGQTFLGRGLDTRSYVPLVAATFVAARGWLEEAPNDPERCDLAQVLGMEMDGKDFEQVQPLLEQARQGRSWLELAGHDIGEPGVQTARVGLLEKLLPYLRDPANGFWTAPMGTVAHAIEQHRRQEPIRVRPGKENRP